LTLFHRLIRVLVASDPGDTRPNLRVRQRETGVKLAVVNGHLVESRGGRERKRVRGDALLREGARADSFPASPDAPREPPATADGTSGRGNPHTGAGRKAAAVRRHGGPGDDDLGHRRTGPGPRRRITSVVRVLETTRARMGEPEPDRRLRAPEWRACSRVDASAAARRETDREPPWSHTRPPVSGPRTSVRVQGRAP